ncbi:MAG: hypothetical protein ACYCSX_05710 [Acidimicrobiales bacterium]
MSTALRGTRADAAARAVPQPARHAPERRPSLEVVAPRAPRVRRVRRRSVATVLAGAVVSLSLLIVVIGHAELAQGQVRLAGLQAEITSARLLHQREVLALANLENPTRILRVAEDTLHMVSPTQVRQLTHVPLGIALPPPHVAPTAGTSPAAPASSGG